MTSSRLDTAFARLSVTRLGQLDGLTYGDIQRRARGCGAVTIVELHSVLEASNALEPPDAWLANDEPRGKRTLAIPKEARTAPLSELPLSTRLDRALQRSGLDSLRTLHGMSRMGLLGLDGVGRGCANELVQLAEALTRARAGADAGDCAALVTRIDAAIAQLSSRERWVLDLRLGAGAAPATLDETAGRLGATWQFAQQLEARAMKRVQRLGGAALWEELRRLCIRCERAVAPLTPELLSAWLPPNVLLALPLAAYVRLIGQLRPAICAWPEAPARGRIGRADVRRALREVARETLEPIPLAAALRRVRDMLAPHAVSAKVLLDVASGSPSVALHWSSPERGSVRAATRITYAHVARLVLEASEGPLSSGEILARAEKRLRRSLDPFSARACEVALTAAKGFYRVARGRFGLRVHVKINSAQYEELALAAERLIDEKLRAVSVREVIAGAALRVVVHASELGALLAADARFVRSGRGQRTAFVRRVIAPA